MKGLWSMVGNPLSPLTKISLQGFENSLQRLTKIDEVRKYPAPSRRTLKNDASPPGDGVVFAFIIFAEMDREQVAGIATG
jgi:hypothetical protein